MPLYPQSATSQGVCPNSLPFRCFQFRFTFESIKELRSASATIDVENSSTIFSCTIEVEEVEEEGKDEEQE
jgi:hypothetical protein